MVCNFCPPEQVGKFRPVGTPKVRAVREGEVREEIPVQTLKERAELLMRPIAQFLNDKEGVPKREIGKALGLDPSSVAYRVDLNRALQLMKTQRLIKQERVGWSPAVTLI